MAARAAVREPRAEADEESPDEHPRELASVSEANHLIEHSKAPDRRPAAAQHCRKKATERQSGDEGQPPSSRQPHRVTREVADREHEAADIFEAGGDTEPSIRDEEEREGDERDAGAGDCPMDRWQSVQDQ